MIRLKTNCEICLHKKTCKFKGNAKANMEKLKKLQYGNSSNDDYDWNTMMKHYNVNIIFSCPDFSNNVAYRNTQGSLNYSNR